MSEFELDVTYRDIQVPTHVYEKWGEDIGEGFRAGVDAMKASTASPIVDEDTSDDVPEINIIRDAEGDFWIEVDDNTWVCSELSGSDSSSKHYRAAIAYYRCHPDETYSTRQEIREQWGIEWESAR